MSTGITTLTEVSPPSEAEANTIAMLACALVRALRIREAGADTATMTVEIVSRDRTYEAWLLTIERVPEKN